MCIQAFPDYQNRERQIAQITDHVLQDLVRRCLRSDHTERPDMAEIISILEDFDKTEHLIVGDNYPATEQLY